MSLSDLVWEQKYRPPSVSDTILPATVKKMLMEQLESGSVPNYLFSGAPGTGKTTAAYAIANALGADVLFVNASLDGNIDTLRTKITQFVSTVSFTDSKKIVVLDEADYLNCFAANQEILTVNSLGDVESKKIGDLCGQEIDVLSVENDKNTIDSGYVFQSGEAEVFKVEFEDGTFIYTTDKHKFFDSNMNEITIDEGIYLKTAE